MEVDAISLGLNKGIQVIDTAEMYGDGKSELLVGKAIKNFPRENLFLISKDFQRMHQEISYRQAWIKYL